MGGDYSRMTFKPHRDYNGVLKQQGRVGLEADHNELVEILDRRWRAESIDIMGRSVVPISNRENITAFQILPAVPSTFTIGRGRMYVDGLLVECHGAGATQYDASLGEERETDPLPANDQPYDPNAPSSPGSGNGLTDLVFVDAWEREVTAVEDAAIREIALGGPDTATRLQTVWQVRVLPKVGAVNCPDTIAAWDALIAPPTGRLTSSAVQPPASDDPCVLSPTGGYRGLENRLYRIQIHDGDSMATARFKWSRDDASILTEVEAIAGGQITVRRIGRDAVLRFRIGDWVELSDDPTEFEFDPTTSAFVPGHMAQVTNIHEANRIVTIAPPPPPGMFNATLATNHTRLRRWDQSVGVDAQGLLQVAAGPIAIEDGIQVEFGPATGTFKAGDYWMFAARTADGSVEELDTAPPRGVVHHYARLALITWSNPPVVSDCRDLWPADGCCTEVVWPGEDIQAAIDRLPDAGGCVCLKAGMHVIRDTLQICRPNVCLHGESIGAIVRSDVAPVLLAIARAANCSVHDIRFELVGREATAIVTISNAIDAAVHDCELIALVEQNPRTTVAGFMMTGETTATIARNEIANVMIGVLAMKSQRVDVIDNRVSAYSSKHAGGNVPIGFAGFVAIVVRQPCRVESNAFDGFAIGAYVGQESAGSTVVRNRITRAGEFVPLLPALIALIPGLVTSLVFYAIDCAAAGAIIANNVMNTTNQRQGGVHVTGPFVRVEGNQITSQLKDWMDPSPRGVFLDAPTDNSWITECVVCGNLLIGPQTGIDAFAVSAAGAERIQVIDNRYRGVRVPNAVLTSFGVRLLNVRGSRIARNEIDSAPIGIGIGGRSTMPGNVVDGNRISGVNLGCLALVQSSLSLRDNLISRAALLGVAMGRCVATEMEDNTIDETFVGVFSVSGASTTIRGTVITDAVEGIAIDGDSDLVVYGNRIENASTSAIATARVVGSAIRRNHVARCAWGTPPGGIQLAAAVLQVLSFTSATIDACTVLNTGLRPDGTLAPLTTFALFQLGVANARVCGNRVDNPILPGAPPHFGVFILLGRNAEIVDNAVTGAGLQPLINVPQLLVGLAVVRFSDVICSGNRCAQTIIGVLGGPPLAASIQIGAVRLAAIGNVVRATNPSLGSFRTFDNSIISAIGNVTSGDWFFGIGSNFAPPLLPNNHLHV